MVKIHKPLKKHSVIVTDGNSLVPVALEIKLFFLPGAAKHSDT